jgi:hypothetical protein
VSCEIDKRCKTASRAYGRVTARNALLRLQTKLWVFRTIVEHVRYGCSHICLWSL